MWLLRLACGLDLCDLLIKLIQKVYVNSNLVLIGFSLNPGIVQSGFHKRRKTGGKKKTWRKKRKFELGRPAANTKVKINSFF